ncbi:retrotransposon hot spot (RHS) protein [Trypanosoma cruzi]|nr:retrotransposon hot spot (RHS) protein [Trypanosoma cruzi]
MLSLHANNVLQRVRVLIGFVCTLILFAALCGHARIDGWENGAGDAWPRLAHRSVHDGVVHIVVLTLRCDCGLLRGNGGGWTRVLARGVTVGSCLLFYLFLPFCEGVHLFLVSVMKQTDRQREKTEKGDKKGR